jgi:putative hydrolase of the HAD superfamily
MARKVSTIGLDADDTLWHNETFFKLSEAHFADLLRDYADQGHLLERLLEAEKRNIHHYGFGIKGFVLSMIETAIEVTDGKVPGHVISQLLSTGQEMLSHPVELLEGVRETVETLAQDYHLILITKGDLLDQERKIAASGIDHLFDAVEVVSDKTARTYARLFTRHGEGAESALMAGNSMKSDVVPAIEAGAHGVFIPFDQVWALEHADPPQDTARFHRLSRLSDLPALLQNLH